MHDIPNLIYLAIPFFLLLLLAEAVASWVLRRDNFEARDTAASLAMGIGNVLVSLATKAVSFVVFMAIYRYRLFDPGWSWPAWALLFVADDFTYYWYHRASHECRFLWASHVVHHSSQKYNLGTALRQTWTGGFTGFVFWAWLPLVGFHPVMVLTMQSVSLLYQFWIHTELVPRLGPLELVLNTPQHHRIHHASNARYLDRNHAGTLIVWDRLFGSFAALEPSDPPQYGLTSNIGTYNPVRIAFHEWLDIVRDVWRAGSWGERWRFAFAHPGWRYRRARTLLPVEVQFLARAPEAEAQGAGGVGGEVGGGG